MARASIQSLERSIAMLQERLRAQRMTELGLDCAVFHETREHLERGVPLPPEVVAANAALEARLARFPGFDCLEVTVIHESRPAQDDLAAPQPFLPPDRTRPYGRP